VRPTGRFGGEGGFVAQPFVAQPAELGGAEVQALGDGPRIELTGVEGGEDFLDIERGNTVSELGLFILEPRINAGTRGGQGEESFSL
jgi:hypothetical protein